MKTSVEQLDERHVQVEVDLSAEEVDAAIRAAEKTVEELKRRPLGEKQLGRDPEAAEENAVLVRATRHAVEHAIRQAVETHVLRLTANPKLDMDRTVDRGRPFSFAVTVETVPQFSLSGYRDLVVPVHFSFEVTEQDVDGRLEEIRGRAAHVERDSAQPVSDGDVVELSFTSYLDGEAYEGNVASGYAYTMGSLHLPAAFEEGLRGAAAGDERSIEFDVPADFENEQIAGRRARFDVRVNRVAHVSYPDVDDAFAREFGYADLASWRRKIARELAEWKSGEYEEAREQAVRAALASRLLQEIPDDLAEQQADRLLAAFKQDLAQQGTSFDEYCRYLGLAERDVRAEMLDEAKALLRENLALEALFRQEGMLLTPAELERTVAQLAEEGGMPQGTSFAQFNDEQKAAFREMTMHRMATEWLVEHARFE